MKTLNEIQAEEITAALPNFTPKNPLSETEFDQLARFIAVTREMKEEPFFSEDNHDTIVTVGGGTKKTAHLGHPAFVKSAILPFRKLWLESEPCRFEEIRKLIWDRYREMRVREFTRLEAYLSHYFGPHDASLARLAPKNLRTGKVSTVRDVIELWIHTTGAHTGKADYIERYSGRFELSDFDEVDRKAGRNEFEWCFRINMLLVAYNSYLHFAQIVAEPIFQHLQSRGYVPKFEVSLALRFNPYLEKNSRLLKDPFWHLDKETEEQTFDRMLKRQRFDGVESLFSSLYFKGMGYAKRNAMTDLKRFENLTDLLSEYSVTRLSQSNKSLSSMGQFSVREDGYGSCSYPVIVYEEKTIYFEGKSEEILRVIYGAFRNAFLRHREHVKRSQELSGYDWNWDE